MIRSSRHRSTMLRLWVLALFAFTALVQPAMAMLGELHELQHDPTHTHSGVQQAVASVELLDVQTLEGDGAGTLHLFAHYAHCCGQSAAPLPVSAIAMLAPVSDSQPTHQSSQPSVVRLVEPDRPPIA